MTHEINGFSNLRPLREVGNTKQSTLSPRAQKILSAIRSTEPQGKTVTLADIDNALLNPSNLNAVKGLIEKSPVGMTLQDNFEGYNPIYMTDEYGSSYFENNKGDRIRVTSHPLAEGLKEVEFTSKDGKYVQRMDYDEKTGKFTDGAIDIFDEFGNREKHYGIGMLTNGKMFVTTLNPETGRIEEEKE